MTRNTHPLLQFRARATTPPTRRPGGTRPRPRAVPQQRRHPVPEQPQAAMALEIQWDGPMPVVAVTGELDLVGGELFAGMVDHVRSTRPGPVAVDLSRVTFVDTHGLTPALRDDVVLVAASRVVCRLLSLMGLPAPAAERDGRPRRGRIAGEA